MPTLMRKRPMPKTISWVLRSRWLPPAAGVAVVAVVLIRLGTGPFLAGFRAVTGWSLLAGVGITVVTTICSAWRWTVVARRLGTEIALTKAVSMYYRSQFLNTTLPGGVLGDVHRGVRQGRDAGDVTRGLRAVVVERLAGQGVQVALTAAVLIAAPSPFRSTATMVAGVGVWGALIATAVIVAGRETTRRPGTARAWGQVVGASVVVIAGYTAMFLLAARVAGAHVSIERLLPLAVLVLLAMAVPTNVGGWGPREGAAAWVFGFAGLGPAMGLTTATVYGVMTIVSCAPGGAVLLVEWLRHVRANRRRLGTAPVAQPRWPAVAAEAREV